MLGAMGLGLSAVALAACAPGLPAITPYPSAGSSAHPREVNIVARDYAFSPDPVDLVPGETVLIHVVNGGTIWHEVVIGDQSVQDAWEIAEAPYVDPPPGPTPVVSPPPGVTGLRVVVASGQRVDVLWTVPGDPAVVRRLIIGCHIPGHYAKGMHVAVRAFTPLAAASRPPSPS